jgi:hypothetical protein
MGNDQPALRALLACEAGLSEPEIGLKHAFVLYVLLIWQTRHEKWGNGYIRTVPGLQKQLIQTAVILSVTFI